MILIEWENKKGKLRRICIGKGCDSLPPLGQSSGGTDTTTISIGGEHFSNDIAVLVDKNFKYGLISKQPSELAFKNVKIKKNLIELSEIVIEFKETKERLSVLSLISIIESNQEEKNEETCDCIH
ncbi:hypothetical protein [Dokdonia pacifica]|nr:hypothetical protein [Dokdonia pacifica]